MIRPDYSGAGLVNLMASVIQARGGRAEYQELGLLPAPELGDARHVALLVIDGLGDDWLRRHSADGLLVRHRLGAMTTVFPATTASAITSYLTGDAPQQHGLTGWFMWLRELGCVMTVLPGTPRFGGVGYGKAGIDVDRLFGHRSAFTRVGGRSAVVSPRQIARSDYNLAHLGPAELRDFDGLKDLVRRTARVLRKARSPTYLYAYWPGLDSIGHEHGIESVAAIEHLAKIEEAIARLKDALAETDTALIIAADHGQIDTTPADLTDLGEHPVLSDCLRIPLCGEPRAAFCYVRPDRVSTFERYCVDVLGDCFELHHSQDLIDAGFYGLGQPHPRLAERVGDYTLLARGHHVIRDSMPFEQPSKQVGVHGGLTASEMQVPVCLLRC